MKPFIISVGNACDVNKPKQFLFFEEKKSPLQSYFMLDVMFYVYIVCVI